MASVHEIFRQGTVTELSTPSETPSATNNTCRICGNAANNSVYAAREFLLGTRDPFDYLECSNCGCVQIEEVPANLGNYYPPNYYSYDLGGDSWPGSYLRDKRTSYKLYGDSLVGMWMSKLAGDFSILARDHGWFSRGSITRDSRILDVGCGSGKLLRRLQRLGFRNLTGLDPYINADIRVGSLMIHKMELADLRGSFDFVMLHHSFEHMPDPLGSLQRIREMLTPGSYALIRIPVAAEAWRTYRVHWVQLDAPRHLYLHTIDSMQYMADRSGFELADIVFDSTSYQFSGSEAYLGNSPTRKQLREFQRKAAVWNSNGIGDQACFYLRCN